MSGQPALDIKGIGAEDPTPFNVGHRGRNGVDEAIQGPVPVHEPPGVSFHVTHVDPYICPSRFEPCVGPSKVVLTDWITHGGTTMSIARSATLEVEYCPFLRLAKVRCDSGGFTAGGDTKFCSNRGDMRLHRARADVERFRDLPVCVVGAEESQDFDLPWG